MWFLTHDWLIQNYNISTLRLYWFLIVTCLFLLKKKQLIIFVTLLLSLFICQVWLVQLKKFLKKKKIFLFFSIIHYWIAFFDPCQNFFSHLFGYINMATNFITHLCLIKPLILDWLFSIWPQYITSSRSVDFWSVSFRLMNILYAHPYTAVLRQCTLTIISLLVGRWNISTNSSMIGHNFVIILAVVIGISIAWRSPASIADFRLLEKKFYTYKSSLFTYK